MANNAAEFPSGLIAGGMVDGYVHVWDTAKLLTDDPEPLIASVEQHQGAINGLQFNPHKDSSHLLASGGSDCEVYVTSLERPEQPNVFIPAPPPNNAKHTADITKVAWNTQVVHILASAAQNGSTYIWDLRQKKAWCELRDPSGGSVADVAWNPDQGLHLVTASGDDRNPVLKLWDLRSSTSLPLATLQGHTEGILSVSWCPWDPSLLLSCGKDNRTMMWDLFHLQPVYDLPISQDGSARSEPQDSSGIFGGLASSAGQRRYHVSWSPCMPAVASACSFDRRVQFYSMHGAKSRLGRAPKWLRKPCGASFAFGGKLASFDSSALEGLGEGKKAAPGTTLLKISQVVEDPALVTFCDDFHQAIDKGDFKGYCANKASTAETERDRQVWGLMKVICFEENARGELLSHLGFDNAAIAAAAEDYVRTKQAENGTATSSSQVAAGAAFQSVDGASAADVFGSSSSPDQPPAPPSPKHEPPKPASDATKLSPGAAAATAEMVAAALAGEQSEPMIRKALVVGNFAAAVDCCLEAGLMAEALLLAQCGDQALWQKTQSAFFDRQKQKYPFLSILYAIIRSEMMNLVLQSDLSKWRETLALLSTYGKSDEFPTMCEALAGRLESERRDLESATLCYMCAANVPRVVAFWTAELKQANASLGRHTDTRALQRYVEKVTVFTQANPVSDMGADCSKYFAEYANLLASQGRLDLAPRYLKGSHIHETILMDRLYHAGSKPPGSKPPPFPFEKVVVSGTRVGAGGAAVTGTAAVGARSSSGAGATGPAAAAGAGGAAALPAGWVQMTDPSTRRTYYVNQASGVSQWEPPVAPKPQSQPAPVSQAAATAYPSARGPAPGYPQAQPQMQAQPQAAAPSPYGQPAAQSGGYYQQQQQPQQQQQQQQIHQQQAQYGGQPQQPQQQQPYGYQQAGPAAAGMYGAQPAAASGYGQAGPATGPYGQQQQQQQQQQQYQQQQQPQQQQPAYSPSAGAGFGGGGAFGAPKPAAAPMSAPAPIPAPAPAPKPAAPVGPPPESVQQLGQLIESITAICSPPEKRQMQMVSAAYAHLLEKWAAGEVGADVLLKLAQLVADLAQRNFAGASAMQTDLANTAWGQHKEWIKGLKVLIQLASKK